MNRSEEEYMEKLLLSPEEAAEVLGVGRSRVYDLIRTASCSACGLASRVEFRWPHYTRTSKA
jgi:plasmid maintenance system antidote protein VapI